MKIGDVMAMYEENVRIEARAHFIDPDLLVHLDRAIGSLYDDCGCESEVYHLMDLLFRERFL